MTRAVGGAYSSGLDLAEEWAGPVSSWPCRFQCAGASERVGVALSSGRGHIGREELPGHPCDPVEPPRYFIALYIHTVCIIQYLCMHTYTCNQATVYSITLLYMKWWRIHFNCQMFSSACCLQMQKRREKGLLFEKYFVMKVKISVLHQMKTQLHIGGWSGGAVVCTLCFEKRSTWVRSSARVISKPV